VVTPPGGASSCSLLFLCFRKVIQEIFSELDKTKVEVPNYLTQKHKNNREQELTLCHLVNRLVPKMHKNAMKCKQNIKQMVYK
jgi:hypothetical protein